MGCKMTKFRTTKSKSDANEKFSNTDLPEPPKPDSPDPRLPLTAKQKFNIVKSWKGVSRAMVQTGVIMFVRLFEENEDILAIFRKFRTLKTKTEQMESSELAEHATIVMNSIDEGIRALDNLDIFFDILHQVGALHTKITGFKKEYFWRIETPFLNAIKMTLDERYTENMDQIYRITIHFIVETLIEGFDNANDVKTDENITFSPHKAAVNFESNASSCKDSGAEIKSSS